MNNPPQQVHRRLPVVLSILVPGAGQFAQRRFALGLFFQGALTGLFLWLLIAFVLNFIATLRTAYGGRDPDTGLLFHGLGLPGLLLGLLYAWNIIDAARATARMKNRQG